VAEQARNENIFDLAKHNGKVKERKDSGDATW
jgi:hypothetical protein